MYRTARKGGKGRDDKVGLGEGGQQGGIMGWPGCLPFWIGLELLCEASLAAASASDSAACLEAGFCHTRRNLYTILPDAFPISLLCLEASIGSP